MTETNDVGVGRRDLLKRTALIGGAVVWTTPVVQSLGGTALATMGSGCACLTGGGAKMPAIYNGRPGTLTFGNGKICCGSPKTTLEVNFHPAGAHGNQGATAWHFTQVLTLNCTTTGNPSPPKNTAAGPNRFVGTSTDNQGAVVTFDLTDNGEPGTNDTGTLSIAKNGVTVLTASGFSVGNLQAHKGKCP